MQAVAAAAAAKDPAGQGAQAVAAAAGAKAPAAQLTQAPTELAPTAAEYLPAPQFKQAAAAMGAAA